MRARCLVSTIFVAYIFMILLQLIFSAFDLYRKDDTFLLISASVNLIVALPTCTIMQYFNLYFIVVGDTFVKQLKESYDVSQWRYRLVIGTFVLLIQIGFINATMMYIILPFSLFTEEQSLCSQDYLKTAQVFLVISYYQPMVMGLLMLLIVRKLAINMEHDIKFEGLTSESHSQVDGTVEQRSGRGLYSEIEEINQNIAATENGSEDGGDKAFVYI